jgi:hypothetical protein
MFPMRSDRNMIGTRRQGQLRSVRADECRRDTHSVSLGSEAIEEPQCRKKQSVAGQLVVKYRSGTTSCLQTFWTTSRLAYKVAVDN